MRLSFTDQQTHTLLFNDLHQHGVFKNIHETVVVLHVEEKFPFQLDIFVCFKSFQVVVSLLYHYFHDGFDPADAAKEAHGRRGCRQGEVFPFRVDRDVKPLYRDFFLVQLLYFRTVMGGVIIELVHRVVGCFPFDLAQVVPRNRLLRGKNRTTEQQYIQEDSFHSLSVFDISVFIALSAGSNADKTPMNNDKDSK